jgi:hypothetical protein
MKRNIKTEYNLAQDIVSVKTSTVIELKEYFNLQTQETPIDILTTIKCDLADVPEKYHEIVLNMLTSKYLNKVSFGTNPFSECKPLVKRKWWQLWKSKYFTN